MGDERGDIGREFGIKRRTRRKVKDGNVSSRIRSCDSDLFSLISHLCLPPPPHPPPFTPPSSAFRALSLCRTCIYFPLFLTPSPFHTLQSLHQREWEWRGRKKKKLLMLSFGAQPVKLALNARTQQHTLV